MKACSLEKQLQPSSGTLRRPVGAFVYFFSVFFSDSNTECELPENKRTFFEFQGRSHSTERHALKSMHMHMHILRDSRTLLCFFCYSEFHGKADLQANMQSKLHKTLDK